jgi:hypothetical protein
VNIEATSLTPFSSDSHLSLDMATHEDVTAIRVREEDDILGYATPCSASTQMYRIEVADAHLFETEFEYPDAHSDSDPSQNGKDDTFRVIFCRETQKYPATAVLACMIIIGLIGVAVCWTLGSPAQCTDGLLISYNSPLKYDRTLPIATDSPRTYNVVLFGDSSIKIPFDDYGLEEKIADLLPDFNFKIENYALDSDRISDMRTRVDSMLEQTKFVT